MFLRQTAQRRADGTVVHHLQIAESVWNKDKKRTETRLLCTLGRMDDLKAVARMRKLAGGILRRCSPEELVSDTNGLRVVDSWSYGDLYVLDRLWKRLGLDVVIRQASKDRRFEFDLERALFAMVANRACEPGSKLYCYEQWLREDVRIPGVADLELQHLYRAMDFLDEVGVDLEKAVYDRLADLFRLDVELVFYDTTSLYFEVDEEDPDPEPDPGAPACGKGDLVVRKRGKSKDKRGDVPQLVVGLAVTRDGLPVRHWVFPGNTVDVQTVDQVKADLRGWHLTRCVFVGDAGMVSAENLHALASGGGRYIVCVPAGDADEPAREVLSRAGRYKPVAENLFVKEVVVGEGERRRRYVSCFNPQEAERQKKHREQILCELAAELRSLRYARAPEGPSRRSCTLRASSRYGRYLRFKGGRLEIHEAKVREDEKRDGHFVLLTNDDTLSVEDVALGYKQLARVEESWRTLKTGLKIRPVFHWAPHRIRAHITLNVLALLIGRIAELACEDTWRNIRDDLKRVKLAQLSGPEGTVWQVTEPLLPARNRLEKLRIDSPPPVLSMV